MSSFRVPRIFGGVVALTTFVFNLVASTVPAHAEILPRTVPAPTIGRALTAVQAYVYTPDFWAYAAAHGAQDPRWVPAAQRDANTKLINALYWGGLGKIIWYGGRDTSYQLQLEFTSGTPSDVDTYNLGLVNARLADPRVVVSVAGGEIMVTLPPDLFASLQGVMYAGEVVTSEVLLNSLTGFAASALSVGASMTVFQYGVVTGNPVVIGVGSVMVVSSLSALIFFSNSVEEEQANIRPAVKVFKEIDSLCWPMTASCRFTEPQYPATGPAVPAGHLPVMQCSRGYGPWGNPQFRKDAVDQGYMIDALKDPTFTCEYTTEFVKR